MPGLPRRAIATEDEKGTMGSMREVSTVPLKLIAVHARWGETARSDGSNQYSTRCATAAWETDMFLAGAPGSMDRALSRQGEWSGNAHQRLHNTIELGHASAPV